MFPVSTSSSGQNPRLLGIAIVVLLVIILVTIYGLIKSNSVEPIVEQAVNDIDREMVLTPPEEESPEAVAAYEEIIKEVAVTTDTITVTEGCTMDPLVVRLTKDATLKIDNQDTVTHTITFEDQNFFNVSAGSVREINITDTFGKGTGIYRYRCNDISLDTNVGVFYVVE